MRATELKLEFVEYMPKELEEGILYISERFSVAIHLCACGCKGKTVTPFGLTISGEKKGWDLINDNGLVTLSPSIGNFSGESPYHAHYFIRKNKVEWC